MESIIMGILFIFLALIALVFVYRYCFYNDGKIDDRKTDIELRLLTLEKCLMNKVSKSKGYDLDKEMMKFELTQRDKLRKKLYDEMIEEMFGKEKDKGVDKDA